jgi:hypothetical protein
MRVALGATDPLLLLETFLRWWVTELRPLVPPSWQRQFARGEVPVFAAHDAGGTDLDSAAPRKTVFRTMNGDAREGLLLLSPKLAHKRSVVLPLTSMRNLDKLVQFEATRFNPMPTGESYFDYYVKSRLFATQRAQVDFYFVRRASIDAALQAAYAAGIALNGVCVGTGDSIVRLPRMLQPRGAAGWLSKRQTQMLRRFVTILLALIGLLAMLNLRTYTAEIRTQKQIDHLKLAAQQTQPKRRLLQSIIGQIDTLNKDRQRPNTISTLAQITHLLPDTVWLTHLTKEHDNFEIQGFAQKASGLIEDFSRSQTFHDIRFSGPIAKDVQMNAERFDLQFRSGPERSDK